MNTSIVAEKRGGGGRLDAGGRQITGKGWSNPSRPVYNTALHSTKIVKVVPIPSPTPKKKDKAEIYPFLTFV